MNKFATAIALAATIGFAPLALAAKHEMKADAKAEAAIAAACKDKKAGDMVKVDGKDVKCPAPAQEKK